MSNIKVDYDILNQKQTPAFYASSLATRPAFGFPGRIFIDTDTPSSGIYRDTGSAWVQVADPGAGTTGTLQQVTTNGNTTTLGIEVQGININDGAGTGLGNTAIGSSNLSVNTTGQYNTAIGFNSLISNISGINNTAVGVSTLTANTTGRYNTAIGNGALTSNTNAEYNTAIGFTSLTLNTTGANNTALGNSSLASNTTASFNTAIGGASLIANTTGGSNTAIGYNSLQANTTASFNTAIGTTALGLNTTGANNTAIGYASLFSNTTASNNVAIGYASLNQNTTGVSNTGVGAQSLNQNTTGSTNTAIGTSALASNTTAGQNTAVGNSSMSANTTGALNTAVGQGSMQANTTGNTNTAIGTSSMLVNTTGTANTAIGYLTLGANTTSNNNTAIGYGSLQVNTGAGNTGIGYGSLSSNTSGTNNVAIGNSALIGNTTASSNTAVGTSALTSASTGGQNTAIGISAGVNISTGTNNSFVGINAGIGITTGSNNSILGNAGTLSATLTSNIILADGGGNIRLFSNDTGKIGINVPITDTPTGQVDIHTSLTNALVLNGNTTNNAYLGLASAGVNKWRIGNTYNAGANSFDIYNIGTSSTALSINSSNNIGIGTSSPTRKLSVVGTIAAILSDANDVQATLSATATSVNLAATYGSTGSYLPLTFSTNSDERMRITSGGNVGIGTSSPNYTLHIDSNTTLTRFQITNSTTGQGGGVGLQIIQDGLNTSLTNRSNGYMSFETIGTERMRIISTGEVGIGVTPTAGNKLWIKGTDSTSGNTTLIAQNSSGTNSFYVRNDSAIFFRPSYPFTTAALANMVLDSSGVIQLSVSSLKYKKDINNYNKGLNEVLKLRPVTFKSKNSLTDGDKIFAGFIAEEIDELGLSEFVIYSQDKTPNALAYSNMTALLTKAIQELNEKLVRNNIN